MYSGSRFLVAALSLNHVLISVGYEGIGA